MDPAERSTSGHVDAGAEPELADARLLGRDVVHVDGRRLGSIEAIVQQLDGERLAVVRRHRILRRWYFVQLAGASLVDGRVIVSAGYGRGRPSLHTARVAS
jgi:hypothetical protein